MRDMSYDRVQSNYDMMRLELIKLILFYITHMIYTQPHWLFSLTGPCQRGRHHHTVFRLKGKLLTLN